MERGNRFSLFEVDGVKCSVATCWDIHAPEMTRVPAIAGARIICHPHGHVADRGSDPLGLTTAEHRAHENGVCVLFAGFAGGYRDGRHWAWRDTRIIAPTGAVMCQVGTDEDELILADIDPTAWVTTGNYHFPEYSVFRDLILDHAEELFGRPVD